MSRSTFRVLFYLKRNAPKKSGLVPVMCRITVNGKVAQFSCKLDVEERLWNVDLGRMGGRSITAQEVNRKFEKIRSEVNKAYQEIFDMDGYVTAEKVRNDYLGMGMTHKTLLAAFRQRIEDVEKLKGKDKKGGGSCNKYCTTYNHLAKFIRQRYKVEDIALKELSPAFITDFEMFLHTDKHLSTNFVWLYLCPLRAMVFKAIDNGWLTTMVERKIVIPQYLQTPTFLFLHLLITILKHQRSKEYVIYDKAVDRMSIDKAATEMFTMNHGVW